MSTAQPVWQRPLAVGAATAITAIVASALVAWSLWPTVAPPRVKRFNYALTEGQRFRSGGRPVVALSPDGRHFVYNAFEGLHLRSMDAVEARLIPGTEAVSTSPFFSPDGESVGYWEAAVGQLKRISLSGGAAVTICAAANPFGVSWSQDNTILFGQPKGIMRVSANGGTPELVIPAKEGEQVYGPQLLPDGDSVLFSVTTGSGPTRWDTAQIVVQSLSTGNRKTLLQGGSDATYVSTGHLVYALGNALFAAAFDVGQLAVSGGPVSVVEGVARPGNPAVFTPTANYGISDGGTLIYVNGLGSSVDITRPIELGTLVWVDRQGREEPIGAPPRRYIYPHLSPDGTRVALDIGDANRDIWVWDLRRRTMTRVTFAPQTDAIPIWSPDGRRLVWASGIGGGGNPLNLYLQTADGTGMAERLTENANVQRPSSFTPDGKVLLLSEGQQSQDIGMLSLDGDRRVTWLVKTTFSELNGEVSPDGRWLAYQSDESGQFQIYVRPFPAVDQGRWQVSTDGGRQPVWARSGRELFYVASDGTLVGVPVENVPGGASFGAGTPTTLVQGAGYWDATDSGNLGRTYDVSPDGRRFIRIKSREGDSNDSRVQESLIIVED